MIGKTNCKAAQEQPCEKVNINIQSDSTSFPGATFTVSYGSYSKTYTWTGSVMTIDIPAYVEYTISFGAVANFTAPASITNTAKTGNSRTVDVTYTLAVEKLTVKVSGITSGYVVTVVNATTGATIGTQTTASKTYSIPAGTKYYVKALSVKNYKKPSNSSTYTAVNGNTRTLTMIYAAGHDGTDNPTNGIYIQDTDGYFHIPDSWDGVYTPNGVAVITDNCSFVIALEDAHNSTCQWGSKGVLVSGITTEEWDADAVGDYDGETQTTNILNELGNSSSTDDAPAAYYCRAYIFPNGKKGYLGASGEWHKAHINREAIISALIKCGGVALSGLYWTSTQYSAESCWFLSWGSNGLSVGYRDRSRSVRSFCSI